MRGGLPLLHPARTLPPGEVRAFGGSAATCRWGRSPARFATRSPIRTQGASTGDATYAKGALVAASIGPGLAPSVGRASGSAGSPRRAGVHGAGAAGRSPPLDRPSTHWSLSLGVAGSAALYGHQDGSSLENVSLGQLHGWGADVPVLVGYESEGSLYMLWMGARAGGEHVDISDVTSEPKAVTLGMPPISLSATRFWGGGLVGFAVGFRHIHVAFELDVAYATITGNYNDTPVTVAGLTVAPATALWWRF